MTAVRFETPKNPMNAFLVAVLAFGIANLVVFLWFVYFSSIVPSVTLSEPKVIGPSDVCPGDIISFSFVIDTTRTAQVEIAAFVIMRQLSRRSAMIDNVIYQIEGDSRLNITRPVEIPEIWNNSDIPESIWWIPGEYYLELYAIVTGQSPREAPLLIPFTIRSDCSEI